MLSEQMDFARKILNKYGWKEGDGLGKNNDGIAKPLKPSLKFDTSGFGSDQAANDFNNHWWQRLFNEAAQNVEIKSDANGELKMKRKNSEVEITTKSYSMQKLKKAKYLNQSAESYNSFTPSVTLITGGCEEVEKKSTMVVEDITVPTFKQLTDQELFQACGGRTAHKGARHGLKLSGKLLRLEQQEKELLAQISRKQNNYNAKKISKESKSKTSSLEESFELKNKIKSHKLDKSENLSEDQKTSQQNESPREKIKKSKLRDKGNVRKCSKLVNQ